MSARARGIRVHFLSGKRGGFGAMLPLIEILRSDINFEISLILTDQHLSKEFGETYQEVESVLDDDIPIHKLDIGQRSGSVGARASALAELQIQLTELLSQELPDVLLLYGDRGESLVGATVATFLNIKIVHLQGGDLSGSVDEWVRHAITKLSHIHYPSTQKSLKRLLQMGEEPWRCIAVGDSHLDGYKNNSFVDWPLVCKSIGLRENRPIMVILQHSETTQPSNSYSQMMETLESVAEFSDFQKVVLYPCSDIGYDGIVAAINEKCLSSDFTVCMNLQANVFRSVLKHAAVIVGNSSAGLIEAPHVGTPTVNVGRRQIDRERGPSVIDVDHNKSDISIALRKVLGWSKKSSFPSPYEIKSDQMAAELIAESLLKQIQNPNVLVKKFCNVV